MLAKRVSLFVLILDVYKRQVYVRESEDLMDGAREVVENALDSCLERNRCV